MLWECCSLSLSPPSQPCLAWTLLVWTISRLVFRPVLSVQSCPAITGLALTLVILTRPDPVPDLWMDFPALPLDLPHRCEFAWRCSLAAETGCFLQACPAPLAGMLAGEVPGPGAVLLHSRPSFSGSSRHMALPNICFPSLNLHSPFLIQTTSVLQFGLI